MNYELKTPEMTYTISTRGAELISIKDNSGRQYIWDAKPEYWEDHAPLLFPICGRLKNFYYTYCGKRYDMGLHGFLRQLEFEVMEYDESHIVLRAVECEESLKQYPFAFEFIATYSVENCKLYSTYSVKNTGSEALPFAFGLHPGLNLFTDNGADIEDYKVKFDTENAVLHPLQKICPTSPESLPITIKNGIYPVSEDGISDAGTVILSSVGTHAVLYSELNGHSVELEYSENLGFFCMWKAEGRDAKFICLEPWSGTPARGVDVEVLETRKRMIRLEPGKTESFFLNLKFSAPTK